MTNDEYLNGIINRYRQPDSYTEEENLVYNEVARTIQCWFNTYMTYQTNGQYISLQIQQSGSRAKGTAIKGKSDIDIFLSFYDPNGYFQLKELYNLVYEELKKKYGTVRKQNVSIGIKYQGFDIDVVPARKVNSQSYLRYNDHYLWSNKRQNRMLTNIQKHIDTVKLSGRINEILLLKIWREQKHLDFPSICLELFTIDAFSSQNTFGNSFEKNILILFMYIRDNIESKRIVDPGNSSNILSDELTTTEKITIKQAAQAAIDATYWSEVVK